MTSVLIAVILLLRGHAYNCIPVTAFHIIHRATSRVSKSWLHFSYCCSTANLLNLCHAILVSNSTSPLASLKLLSLDIVNLSKEQPIESHSPVLHLPNCQTCWQCTCLFKQINYVKLSLYKPYKTKSSQAT